MLSEYFVLRLAQDPVKSNQQQGLKSLLPSEEGGNSHGEGRGGGGGRGTGKKGE